MNKHKLKTFFSSTKINKDLFNKLTSLKLMRKEFHVESQTKKVYLMFTSIATFRPHKIYIEDIIGNEDFKKKIEIDSLLYIHYIYGVLKASEKNDIYVFVEGNLQNNTLTVQQLSTNNKFTWSIAEFKMNYMLLDKESILNICLFLSSHLSLNHVTSSQEMPFVKHLHLVK